jgi:hypothetical protein
LYESFPLVHRLLPLGIAFLIGAVSAGTLAGLLVPWAWSWGHGEGFVLTPALPELIDGLFRKAEWRWICWWALFRRGYRRTKASFIQSQTPFLGNYCQELVNNGSILMQWRHWV